MQSSAHQEPSYRTPTHYTTFISATNLAERLADAPGSVLVI